MKPKSIYPWSGVKPCKYNNKYPHYVFEHIKIIRKITEEKQSEAEETRQDKITTLEIYL